MDVNYINSFMLGAEDIIAQMAPNVKLERQELQTKKKPVAVDSIVTVVGFNGDISGQVILTFKRQFALHLAGSMCGMELQEVDDLALSALGEVANMVSGRAVIKLEELANKKVNITPPTVMHSEDDININIKAPVICIPYQNSNETGLEINFSLESKGN